MQEEQRPVLRWAGDGVAAEAARQRLADSGRVEVEAFTHEDSIGCDGVDVSIALMTRRGNIADGALPFACSSGRAWRAERGNAGR